jgi:hypothetical protein
MPQTPQFDPTAAYQPAATTAVFDPNADYAPAKKTAPQAGLLDREIQLNDHWDAWGSGLQSVGRGVRDAVKGTWDTLAKPPQDKTETAIGAIGPAALPLYRMLRGMGHTAEDATQVVGAIHDINDSADPTGSYLKVAQETAGQGAGQAITALATEGAVRAPGALSEAAGAVREAVPAAVQRVSGAVRAIDPDIVGIASPRGAHFLKVAQRAAKVANKYATRAAESAAEPAAATSAADDLEGVTSPQTEAAGESVEEAPPDTPAAAAAPKIDTSPKAVQQQLEKSLGGQKLVPGVPLKNQVAAQGAAAGKLPEGFTPVESSALKGYKYDPAAREFEYITTDGSHYIRGDVAPEAADQFEKTAVEKNSIGKAWHELRQNPQGGVGVAKVINGKRVPIVKTAPLTDLQQQIKESVPPSQAPTGAPLTDLSKQIKQSAKRTVVVDPASGKPEFSDVIEAKQAKPAAAAAPPEEDLSAPDSDWQKTLEQAKAKKAAAAPAVEEIPDNVMTMRDPGDLAKRWGVDSKAWLPAASKRAA